jgi:hypothetical protein
VIDPATAHLQGSFVKPNRQLPPMRYYLVLPWHFRPEIVQRESAMLAAGVGLIFPLPTIEIVREPAPAVR